MLRKRLTSDKHGTTYPNTHHPGVVEGPCSWSPLLRRRQDRAGPRTVAPGPNGRLVHAREKYVRRRRSSGPVGRIGEQAGGPDRRVRAEPDRRGGVVPVRSTDGRAGRTSQAGRSAQAWLRGA